MSKKYRLKKSAILLIPMGVGMLIYSDVVTWILLGEKWMEAKTAIGTVGIMHSLTVLYANFASEVYRSKGEPKVSFSVQILYIFFIIPIVMYGATKSFKELCILRAACMGVFIIIHLAFLKFRYKFSILKMLKNIWYPTIASIIMAIVGFILHSNIYSMTIKTASIIICIIIYFIICMLIKDTRDIILDVLKKERRLSKNN